MHVTRRLAVGLSLAISLATTSAVAASSALAAAPAHTGSFGTWKAAQKAAGFALHAPAWHHGLPRAGHISVEACPSGKLAAVVTYGSFKHALLSLEQTRSTARCGQAVTGTRKLGTYRIHGVRATLSGICPVPGASCASKRIVLLLRWHIGGVHYLAVSRNVWPSAIVRFAGSLTAVG